MVRYIPHYTSILSWFPSSFLVATIKVTLGLSKGPSDLPFLFLFVVISLRCVLFFPCSLYTYIYMCVYICVCVWSCLVAQSPVFLPGKSHGQRSLVGCSPWGCKRIGHTQNNYTHTHTHTHTHNIHTCIHMNAYIYIYMNMYLYILLKIVTFKWLYAMAALKKLLLLHFVIEKD